MYVCIVQLHSYILHVFLFEQILVSGQRRKIEHFIIAIHRFLAGEEPIAGWRTDMQDAWLALHPEPRGCSE